MAEEVVVVGVDVGGTGTKAGLVDATGTVLVRIEHPTEPTAGTKGIISVVEELVARAPELDLRIAAVGVGAAGFVDFDRGCVIFSPNLTYDDPHIKDALAARLDLPVFVDNDANAAAWGERRFGCAQGLDHVALLTIGTGIGSGFIAEGRLVRGSTGAGAEIGHTVVELGGPRCSCGLRGCLEQFASGKAIARLAKEALEENDASRIVELAGSVELVTARDVARAAAELDETACAVLRRAGRALGVGLSNVVNIFDPQAIVLGGSVVEAGEPFLGPARDQLFEMTLAQRRRPMRLDVTSLGESAGILGAAALAFDHVRG